MTPLEKALKKLKEAEFTELGGGWLVNVEDVEKILEEMEIDMENEFMGTTWADPPDKKS